MKQPVERRLAAILAADVAGYSRLMGADEAGTAQALRDHRAAADPLVAQHGGRSTRASPAPGMRAAFLGYLPVNAIARSSMSRPRCA
jgi:class 3 adenylate cyclase